MKEPCLQRINRFTNSFIPGLLVINHARPGYELHFRPPLGRISIMETSNDKPAGCRERPACFGDFERVFFIGKYGVREVRSVCRACPCVKDCLGAAAESPTGQELRAARI